MSEAPPRAERPQHYAIPRLRGEWPPRQPRTVMPAATVPSRQQRGGRVSTRTVRLAQLAVVLGMAAAVALAYLLHDGLRAEMTRALTVLANGNGPAIGDYLRSYGVWAPVASLFLMLVQALAAPVPAILVAFANGLTFGVFWGGVLTVAGQTLAAVVCFWIARALGRGPAEALTNRFGLDAADRWLTRWGARGIVILRLVPGISFDVVSYGAGLTGIGFGPFLVATALGVTPQAFLYAYLIREAPQSAWAFYAVSWLLVSIVVATAVVRARRRSGESPKRRREPMPYAARPLASCD
ncbi:MAG: TVP38/TMEM64 family protein [Thermomicrobiales bacterium]